MMAKSLILGSPVKTPTLLRLCNVSSRLRTSSGIIPRCSVGQNRPHPMDILKLSSGLSFLDLIVNLSSANAEDLDDVLASVDDTVLSLADTIQANPEIAFGALAVTFVPVLLALLLTRKGYAGDLAPKVVLEFLEKENSELLDIRSKASQASGSPSLKSVKKKSISVPFEIEEDGTIFPDPAFAENVLAAKLEKETETIVIDE